MECELGHTNYQLGEAGKAGIRMSPLTPAPSVVPGVTVTDIAAYQALADAEDGHSPGNVVSYHYDRSVLRTDKQRPSR